MVLFIYAINLSGVELFDMHFPDGALSLIACGCHDWSS